MKLGEENEDYMAINVKEFVKKKSMKMSEKDVHDVVLKYVNRIESIEKENNEYN